MTVFSIMLKQGQRFECEPETNVLAGMMARGRKDIMVGCRGGGCGVCKVRVLQGRYRTGAMSTACVSADERARGMALACKLYAESDVEIEVVGKLGKVIERARQGTFDPSFGSKRLTAEFPEH